MSTMGTRTTNGSNSFPDPRSLVIRYLQSGVAMVGAACGGPQWNKAAVLREHQRMRQGRTIDANPHAALWLPQTPFNQTLAKLLPIELPLPIEAPKLLARVTSRRLQLVIAALAVTAQPDNQIAVELTIDLRLASTQQTAGLVVAGDAVSLLRISGQGIGRVVAVLRPPQPCVIETQIDPDSLRSATWTVTAPPLHHFTTKPVDAVTATLRNWIADHGGATLREAVVAAAPMIAQHVRFRIELPHLPIADFVVETKTDADPGIAIWLRTNLPVAVGLPSRQLPKTKQPVLLVVSNDTVAEIGNWAVANRDMPPAVEKKLAEQYPLLTWREGKKPLAIDLFRLTAPRGRTRIGAVPFARRNQTTPALFDVGIGAGEVEESSGPAWYEALAWAKAVFEGTIDRTASIATSSTIDFGGTRVNATLNQLELNLAESATTMTFDLHR